MVAKKRKNDEINEFLSAFESWISNRLQKIEAVKLSAEHIAQTESDIKEIKKKIDETKKLMKEQEKKYKETILLIQKSNKGKQTKIPAMLFETNQVDGIEIFQVVEEEEQLSETSEEDEI
jgi:hypothetical protein